MGRSRLSPCKTLHKCTFVNYIKTHTQVSSSKNKEKMFMALPTERTVCEMQDSCIQALCFHQLNSELNVTHCRHRPKLSHCLPGSTQATCLLLISIRASDPNDRSKHSCLLPIPCCDISHLPLAPLLLRVVLSLGFSSCSSVALTDPPLSSPSTFACFCCCHLHPALFSGHQSHLSFLSYLPSSDLCNSQWYISSS